MDCPEKGDVASKRMWIFCTNSSCQNRFIQLIGEAVVKLSFLTNNAYIQLWQLEFVQEIYSFSTGHVSFRIHLSKNTRNSQLRVGKLLKSSWRLSWKVTTSCPCSWRHSWTPTTSCPSSPTSHRNQTHTLYKEKV